MGFSDHILICIHKAWRLKAGALKLHRKLNWKGLCGLSGRAWAVVLNIFKPGFLETGQALSPELIQLPFSLLLLCCRAIVFIGATRKLFAFLDLLLLYGHSTSVSLQDGPSQVSCWVSQELRFPCSLSSAHGNPWKAFPFSLAVR